MRRPAPEKPLIAPLNKEPSQEQVYEGYYVGALASLFVVILLQGVALSASGESIGCGRAWYLQVPTLFVAAAENLLIATWPFL